MGPGKRRDDTFDDYLFRIARRYYEVSATAHFRNATLRERREFQAIGAMAGDSKALKLCTELANYWRTVLADQGSPYRPELYYMRGPGPKWREAQARPRDTR